MATELTRDTPKSLRSKPRKRLSATRGKVGARAALRFSGLPEEVVADIESRRTVDWRMLAGALDGLYMAAGGALGVRRVMNTPAKALDGLTPIDALRDADGPERVARFIWQVAQQLRLSRI